MYLYVCVYMQRVFAKCFALMSFDGDDTKDNKGLHQVKIDVEVYVYAYACVYTCEHVCAYVYLYDMDVSTESTISCLSL